VLRLGVSDRALEEGLGGVHPIELKEGVTRWAPHSHQTAGALAAARCPSSASGDHRIPARVLQSSKLWSMLGAKEQRGER